MADINNVILVGRLTRNAELKYTNSGLAVSKVGMAINKRRKKDERWVEEAHFFDVVIWGKTAESLQPYLVKGKQIGVQGELRQNRWEQDGQPRSKVEIVATNIQLLGGRVDGQERVKGNSDNSPGGEPPISDDFEDDIPF